MAKSRIELFAEGRRTPAAIVRFDYSNPTRGKVKVEGDLADAVDDWLSMPATVYRPDGSLTGKMPQHWDWLRARLYAATNSQASPFVRMRIVDAPKMKRMPASADPAVDQ